MTLCLRRALPARRPLATSAAALLLAVPVLAACSDAPADRTVAVTGPDAECAAAATTVEAGVVAFTFSNEASKENELYVLRSDGSIVGEREGVGPGTTATLTVEVEPGSYALRCKPGMTGDGITTALTVTAAAATAAPATTDPTVAAAVTAYRAYVAEQVAATVTTTQALQAALEAGDAGRARSLYAASRVGWERIEPVAESFGDLDPKIDLREADLEDGQTWTGWHVVEKGLWTGPAADGPAAAATAATKALAPVGERLLADLADLQGRVPTATITATSMANGAKELLDEVATGKVTGEEEAFSHTDLVDVRANVDGARK
ncbi:MAG: peptidase M75 family protein, partial [Actinobacteria bacterium]|nr:peptidase M75 family protein [Actinomycetota bacterium]